jgi:hypothetical protein
MSSIPPEVCCDFLKYCDRHTLTNVCLVNKNYYNCSLPYIYSHISIMECYNYKKDFEQTKKFFRIVGNIDDLCRKIKRLEIKWYYPPKLERGYDRLIEPICNLLRRANNLKYLSMNIKLSKNCYKKIFSKEYTFSLKDFTCCKVEEIVKRNLLKNS